MGSDELAPLYQKGDEEAT
jgi:hypothetical protein